MIRASFLIGSVYRRLRAQSNPAVAEDQKKPGNQSIRQGTSEVRNPSNNAFASRRPNSMDARMNS
jgi:hypothetical protein